MFEPLLHALPVVLEWQNFLAMVAGVIAGIAIGAMPGISGTMAISILIPLTFFLDPLVALGMIAGIYNGAMYGGAIPAILLRIPGTPAAVATTFDGYPMAQAGQAGQALQIACVSSAVGGMISATALMTLAPPLSLITLAFGPPEIFWVAVFGIASVSFFLGKDPIKGLLSACIGLIASLVGIDVITGADRFTFGRLELVDGINIVVLLVGLYALSPAVSLLEDTSFKSMMKDSRIAISNLFKEIPHMIRFWKIWLRSGMIGVMVGILPGAGGSLAAFMSYNETVRASKDRASFGKGNPEGVAAAECGNNSDNGAALIPALTLGIPGSTIVAVIMGALMIQGLQPGPELFRDHPDVVYGFMIQMFLSSFLLLLLGGSVATNTFAQLLRIPPSILGPIILSLMVVGVYSIQGSMFDVYLMFGFGLLGYGMEKLKMPLAPAVLGLILGDYAEKNFRLSLMISRDDFSIFWTRPICQIILALTAAVILWPAIRGILAKRRLKKEAEEPNNAGSGAT